MLNDDDVVPVHADHSVEEQLCREAEEMDAFYEAARQQFSKLSPTPSDNDMPIPSSEDNHPDTQVLSEDNHPEVDTHEDDFYDASCALHPRSRPGARDEFWSDSE